MVGIIVHPFGMADFWRRTVSFRGCIFFFGGEGRFCLAVFFFFFVVVVVVVVVVAWQFDDSYFIYAPGN